MVMHPDTKAKVDALIERNDWGVVSFEEACVWADEVRALMRKDPSTLSSDMKRRYDIGKERRYDTTGPLHYVNPKPNHDLENRITCEGPCILSAIENAFSQLAKSSDRAKRQDALFFLTHFIGDLHQPLHVSFGHDRGGNRTYVDWFLDDKAAAALKVFLAEIKAGKRPSKRAPYCANLHAIFDTCLLEQGSLNISYDVDSNQEIGNFTIAAEQGVFKTNFLLPRLGVLMRKGTLGIPNGKPVKNIPPIPMSTNHAGTIQDWASLSFEFTIDEAVGYCNRVNGACVAALPRLSKTSAEREAKKQKYYQQHIGRLSVRLLDAGLHMAGFIEQAMGTADET